MQKYKLKSDKTVEFNLAPIEEALTLYRAIVYECKGAGVDLTLESETTVADILKKNIDAILSIVGSEIVLEAAKECAKHVLYDRRKFTMDLFEDAENRKDFMPLMILVCCENLRYFFAEAHIVFDVVLSQIVK